MQKQFIPGWLVRVIVAQLTYLLVASGIVAIFWAITGQAPSVPTTLIYTFLVGNITVITLETIKLPCTWRQSPWFVFLDLGLLIAVVPVAVTIATAVVFVLIPPARRISFWAYLVTAWKFPTVASVIFGGGYLGFKAMRNRLLERNRELRETVDIEIAGGERGATELRQAREIQQGLLPKEIPQVAGFHIAAAWEPATAVSGDYYDVIRLNKYELALCIADVSGKGISAALLMANVQAAVRACASEYSSPSKVCNQVNSVLCTNAATEKFVTLFYGVLDARRHTLQYTSAGHPRPVLIHRNGTTNHLQNDGALMGIFPNWKYADSSIELHSGDALLLFTDGITEAMSKEGIEFGEERLIGALSLLSASPPEQIPGVLLDKIRQHCGPRMSDDATLLVVAADRDLDHIEIEQGLMEFAGAQL